MDDRVRACWLDEFSTNTSLDAYRYHLGRSLCDERVLVIHKMIQDLSKLYDLRIHQQFSHEIPVMFVVGLHE